ncbi:MAG: hypothetical protein U0R70_11190 [Solirubrobacteraceae bacterium]
MQQTDPAAALIMPAPRLHVVHDPQDTKAHARSMRAAHRPEAGTAVMWVTPGARTLHWTALDLQEALGKDEGRVGAVRNEQARWIQALAWLAGGPVRRLIVGRAQLLSPSQARRLLEAACISGAELWLVSGQAALKRGMRELLAAWPVQAHTFAQALAAWGRPPRRRRGTGAARRGTASGPPVLAADFTLYAHAAEQAFSGRRLRALQARHARAWKAGRDAAARPDFRQAAGSRLAELVQDAAGSDELLASVRGFQTGCFLEGWLVRCDAATLLAARNAHPVSPLDGHAAAELRAFPATRPAAIAALALMGLEPAQIAALRMRDLPASGRLRASGRRAVPEEARWALGAHRLARLLAGAGPDDPLFTYEPGGKGGSEPRPVTAHGTRKMLSVIARQSGLLLGGRWTDHAGDARHRLQREGIALIQIGEPSAAGPAQGAAGDDDHDDPGDRDRRRPARGRRAAAARDRDHADHDHRGGGGGSALPGRGRSRRATPPTTPPTTGGAAGGMKKTMKTAAASAARKEARS